MKVFLSILLFYPFFVSAQMLPQSISVSVSPDSPKPNEQVRVSLESISTDLGQATIIWRSQGKILTQGVGETVITYTAGAIGTSGVFDIEIRTIEGDIVREQLRIPVASVDILWEAIDSYTPPFYKGKALPAQDAVIRYVAMPRTNESPNTLRFDWEVSGRKIGEASGTGRQSFIKALEMAEETISVYTESVATIFQSRTTVTIRPYTPFVLFYRKEGGVRYENAISESFFVSQRATLVAAPYYLSNIDQITDVYDFSWILNNEPFTQTGSPLEIRFSTATEGESSLVFSLTHTEKIFQEAISTLRLFLSP